MSNVFTASINNQKQFILPVTNLLPQDFAGLANTTSPQTWTAIVIPDAIRNGGYDYISFSCSPASSVNTSSVISTPVCVVNIMYQLPAIEAGVLTVLPNLTDITLTGNPATYEVEIRPKNGELLPIDLKCVYAIKQGRGVYSTQTQVTNITLWKTFFTSDANNSSTFLKDGLLYQGVNSNSAP